MDDEIIAALFGMFCVAVSVWGLPLLGFLLARSRSKRLERRIIDLETEVLRLGALVDGDAPRRPVPPTPTVEPEVAPPPVAPPEVVPAPPVVEAPVLPPVAPPPVTTPPPPVPPPAKPRPAFSLDRLVYLLAAGIGAILILGATGFGLSVAAERGYLVPSARVGFGLLACTGAWVASWHLRARAPSVMSAIAGTAAGALYAVLYAAHGMYQFIDATTTFMAMVGVTVVAALHALKVGSRGVAWVGLLGGFLAPVLVSTGSNSPVTFFTYLTVLVGGALFVASRRRWTELVWGAAIGASLEYVGWVATWYALDQVPYGVAATLLLSIPFAVTAIRDEESAGAHALAWAVGMPLLALPWLTPEIDPSYDVQSSLPLRSIAGNSAAWTAIGLLLIPLPGLLALRVRGSRLGALGSLVVLAMLALGATSWSTALPVPVEALCLGALAPLALVTGIFGRHPLSRIYDVVPLITGMVLFSAATVLGPAWQVMAAMLAMGALVLSDYRVSRSAWRLPAGLAATGVVLLAATTRGWEDGDLGALVPATLVALALYGQAPLLLRRGSPATVAFVTAAVAPLVAYLPLHLAWVERLGEGWVGLLPLMLALHALVGATMLVRRGEVSRHGPVLGAFAAIAMLGVTLALPLQLETAALTVGLALEGAALAWLSTRIRHVSLWWGSVILGVGVGARLLLNPEVFTYGDATGMILFNWTLYTWGLPALALVASAWWLSKTLEEDGFRLPLAALGLLLLATVEGFALVNMEVSHAFRDAGPISVFATGLAEGVVRSLSWGLYGMALLGAGLWRDVRALRLIGFAFVLLGAGRVFAVDLWSLQGFARVLSMLGLGVCLLVSAFVFERLVLRGGRSTDKEETP